MYGFDFIDVFVVEILLVGVEGLFDLVLVVMGVLILICDWFEKSFVELGVEEMVV